MLIDNLVSFTMEFIFILKVDEYSCLVYLFNHLINQSLAGKCLHCFCFICVCFYNKCYNSNACPCAEFENYFLRFNS